MGEVFEDNSVGQGGLEDNRGGFFFQLSSLPVCFPL